MKRNPIRPGSPRSRGLQLVLLSSVLVGVTGCSQTAFDLGQRALQQGDPAAAIAHFDAALAQDVRPAESARERAAAQIAQGDFAPALATLEDLRQSRPADKRLLWLLGQGYSQTDRPALAAAAYQEYERLTSRRSVRRQVQLRVAQLQKEVARAGAAALLAQRGQGVAADPNSVAVYSFAADAGENATLQEEKVCRALNIWVAADLAKVKSLKVIAANQLDLLYAEQEFTYENRQMFQASSLVRTGNLQPARHMIKGTYGPYGDDQIGLGAVCFDADRNESTSCATVSGPSKDLFDLETELVLAILGSIGMEPDAEDRVALGIKPTRNLDAFLAFADGVYLRDIGNMEDAALAFAEAAKIDPGFTMAKQFQSSMEAQMMDDVVVVDPPLGPQTASERAQASAGQLGLGLIPDANTGDAQGGGTNGVTTVRGAATVRVRGEAGGSRR